MTKQNNKSILIVDDDMIAISALKNIIGSTYTIYAVKNGKEAVEKAKKLSPDLILLDVCMPNMDGYETIARLKNSEVTKSIPVIFVSSYTEGDDIKNGITNGAVDYITKPFSHDSVIEKIEDAIRSKQLIAS